MDGHPWEKCETCGANYPFSDVLAHHCSMKLTAPHGLIEANREASAAMARMTNGRVHALFMTGASVAEIARMFCVLESDIEVALRSHIARRMREAKR